MIQFNLLPDVKLEYAKTRKTKRIVILGVLSATALAVFVFVLLFMIVNVFQKNHLKNLDEDISKKTSELKNVPDLDKVLTVQNQLKDLPGLHEAKPATSRLTDYLVLLTPSDAKITDVTIDYVAGTLSINGTATTIEVINRFADTLKFTDYKEGEVTEKAFSEVVLQNFGVASKADRVSYGLQFKFKPVIFDNTKSVQLIVPTMVSTRSKTEEPTDLFEKKELIKPQEQGQ